MSELPWQERDTMSNRSTAGCMVCSLRIVPLLIALAAAAPSAMAQLSFTAAVDMAQRSSPRVKMAQADVDRARAALAESHDVYVPAIIGGSGLGKSYGPPLGQPAIFSVSAQSLLFNYSQRSYIRAARASFDASSLALHEVQQQVAEDTVETYFSLNNAQERKAALTEEYGFATNLVSIVQERLDAGMETRMELLQARRTVAQLQLQQLRLDDDIASYNDHLSRLIGLTGSKVATAPDSIPSFPTGGPAAPAGIADGSAFPDNPGVAAAFSVAKAKMEQARGDSHYLWRPQVLLEMEYSRFSNINNYSTYYPAFGMFTLNAESIGVQVLLPMFDRVHRDKARESMADAMHAQHDAENIRDQALEGRLKLEHTTKELNARKELAAIDRDIAKDQLDVVLIQVQTPNPGATPMTPKDEANARIQERQKYLDYLDADFQLHQTEINLLKQTGKLEQWIQSITQSPTPDSAAKR